MKVLLQMLKCLYTSGVAPRTFARAPLHKNATRPGKSPGTYFTL